VFAKCLKLDDLPQIAADGDFMPHEFDLIARLRERANVRPPVILGIGDDAAVLRHPAETREVVTTDMLMDGVDFRVGEVAPELIGRKCLAVNLSDLAAMGARPTAAFVSVALPTLQGQPFAERLFAGLFHLAEEFEITIAGGDTNTWNSPLVVSVTALGDVTERGPVLRSGAQPGDSIFVTGACGGSLAGRHFTFTPRVREAQALLRLVPVHSLIDISDGLAADLQHLLDESGVGGIVYAESIPIHPDVPAELASHDRLQAALGDGEDFELLFTIDPRDEAQLLNSWDLATRLTKVGVVTREPGAWLRSAEGNLKPLPRVGWKHKL